MLLTMQRMKDVTREELQATLELQSALIDVLRDCSAQLDLDSLLQMVVDSATKLTGAEYGAFFHKGEAPDDGFSLYNLSGIDASAFAKMPNIRNTPFFNPTFVLGQIVRSGNIRQHPNYAKAEPIEGQRPGLPEGHPPVTSYLAVPVKARGGDIFGALLFAHSQPNKFTELHEKVAVSIAAQASVGLENALLYKKAQEAVRMRDDFMSIAAHEIRTPLTPLGLQIQMLKNLTGKCGLPAQMQAAATKSLEIADKQVKRLTGLVEELLDVSRIRAGRLTLDYEEVDLCELTRDVAERYALQAMTVGSIIEVECSKGGITLLADRFRLQQVVVNLVANALKYAPGSPLIITMFKSEDQVYIRFKDYGPGIAAEDQERIFNRFERAHGDLKRGGLGLGLYLGREIVEAHGGTIQVVSEVDKGAIFMVALPIKKLESSF